MSRIYVICFLVFYFSHGFAQEILTPEKLFQLKRISGGKVSPDGKKVLYEVKTISIENNSSNTDIYIYDLKKKTQTQLTATPFSEMETTWGKNNSIWFLSTENKSVQLWRMNEQGEDKTQVSNIKEFEIEGFKLSPDESKILFIGAVKMKTTLKDKHPDLPLLNARLENDLMYRHWNSWQDDTRKHLFIYDYKSNLLGLSGLDLLENENVDGILPPFGGSEQITFSENSKKIVYSCKKLNGKRFAQSTNTQLYEYDIEKRTTSTLTEAYKGYDAQPRFFGNGLYWLSMAENGCESAKNNLIYRDLTTNKDINLTQKHDITIEEFVLSADGKTAYLLVPYKGLRSIFQLNIATQELKQITKKEYDYTSLALNDKEIISIRQSFIEPGDIVSIQKNSEEKLTDINKDILHKLDLPSAQERWIETTDGKKMHTWVILPPKFNSNRKYPAILYCQGGPQSIVSQFFSYRWNLATIASQGYIIIAPNRRGLPGFGQEWNDAISKDWGGQAIQDYLSAVDNISNEPYIDVNRIGAVGASYGGYSVYMLAGVHGGRFKTFISHCGLFNLESWYGTTEELFFANWEHGGPYWKEENKAYYKKNSPHNYVQNWNTPILVIHGGVDFRVPESEGLQAFQAAQLMGLRSKLLYFPKEGHWVTSPQNGILWYREFLEWLDTDLKK